MPLRAFFIQVTLEFPRVERFSRISGQASRRAWDLLGILMGMAGSLFDPPTAYFATIPNSTSFNWSGLRRPGPALSFSRVRLAVLKIPGKVILGEVLSR